MSLRNLMPANVSTAGMTKWAWGGLLVLLIANVPLFLCLQLNGDAAYYDLQVQCLAEGGVLYRDMIEPNLPGVVWVQMLVRTLAGSSTVALRAFDLLVLAAIVCLLLVWNRSRQGGRPGLTEPCLAIAIVWFYLSLTVWSHCQRDVWMMLPALGALLLRDRNTVLLREHASLRSLCMGSIVEGVLWGCAFWLKPHIAVPAILVGLASVYGCGWQRRTWAGFALVVLGGAVTGVVGSVWLMACGAWPHLWEMLMEWNPEYLAARGKINLIQGHRDILLNCAPWSWAHLVALPYAAAKLIGWPQLPHCMPPPDAKSNRRESLLCALYAGWVLQTFALQHPFAYAHVPGIILAMAVFAGMRWDADWVCVPRMATALAFGAAFLLSPATKWERLACWKDCVTQGPTLEIREGLQIESGPYWEYYPAVAGFLRSRGVQDEDVLVYSSSLLSLYHDLDLRSPTRFVLTDVHAGFFASRIADIHEAIRQSPHRYVVSDLMGTGVAAETLDQSDPETGLPADFPESKLRLYPSTQPVVFRSGWFVVHAVRQPLGPIFEWQTTNE